MVYINDYQIKKKNSYHYFSICRSQNFEIGFNTTVLLLLKVDLYRFSNFLNVLPPPFSFEPTSWRLPEDPELSSFTLYHCVLLKILVCPLHFLRTPILCNPTRVGQISTSIRQISKVSPDCFENHQV